LKKNVNLKLKKRKKKKKKKIADRDIYTLWWSNWNSRRYSYRMKVFHLIYDQVRNSLEERFLKHVQQLFKTISIMDPKSV